MQVEGVRRDSIELLKSALSKAPEALNAVDVRRPSGKLIRPMCDPEVLGVADINESIVAAPAVRVNNHFRGYAATNNGLQCGFLAVRHDLSVDLAISLQETKDDGLAGGAPTTLAAPAPGTKVRFIYFHLARR